MKNTRIIFFISLVCISLNSWSQSAAKETSDVQFYGKAETTFPLFVGAGLGLSIFNHYDLNLMLGLTPEPYYKVIGEAAANFGGTSAYKDVVVAAFQNNMMVRTQGNYFFESPRAGWLLGGAFSYLSSKGKAGVDRVLTAATGKDFSNLKNALLVAGKSTEVDIDAKIMILDARAGYGWDLGHDLTVKTTLGVAKVISSEVALKSGLAFESTTYGNSLMRTAESDIQSIINDNGMTPTINVDISYLF